MLKVSLLGWVFFKDSKHRYSPTGTPRPIGISRRVEDQISTNFHVIFMYFLRNFDWQKLDVILVKFQDKWKHSKRFSFVSNFKKLTFAKLFSINLSSKSPWCSTAPLKFVSPTLKKELPQVSFLSIFTEQLLYNIIFGRLHCYKVTFVKKCNKPLLEKSETKIFDQKRFIKNLLKVSEANESVVLRINQKMSKLLTLSKR